MKSLKSWSGAPWAVVPSIGIDGDRRGGRYDGYPISEILAFPYKTYEVAKYLTRTKFGVSATSAITVNTDTWNDMPKHAREIFRDVAQNYGKWQIGIDNGKINIFNTLGGLSAPIATDTGTVLLADQAIDLALTLSGFGNLDFLTVLFEAAKSVAINR